MLTAYLATSQPYRWLSVNVEQVKCGFVLDSAAIYAIAENKRLAVDCYEDAILRDSIIKQQENEIAMTNNAFKSLRVQNAELKSTLHTQAKELYAERPKKWKWGAIGFGLGFVLKMLL